MEADGGFEVHGRAGMTASVAERGGPVLLRVTSRRRMRTTIEIDNALMRKAMASTGCKTKHAVVEEACAFSCE
jgi:hypothetical protein